MKSTEHLMQSTSECKQSIENLISETYITGKKKRVQGEKILRQVLRNNRAYYTKLFLYTKPGS